MAKIVIGGFEITKEYKKRLLAELKVEGVKNEADLEHYMTNYWYTKDMASNSHLLLSNSPKKRNFAFPIIEKDEAEEQ